MTKIAAVQMASGPQVQVNLSEAERLVAMAVSQGAAVVVLPENFAFMGMKDHDKLAVAETEGRGPIQGAMSRLAARLGVWIVAGTIPLRGAEPNRVFPSCLVYNNRGAQVARFDKIHLFDVSIVGSDETYKESDTLIPGNEVVVVEGTPVGCLGLAVCYDLRFPELFRALASKGAEVVALPAAFTQITGRAHWEVLVRARAIENLSYVVAAAQGGYHASGRETHGDSLIVDPWGTVLDRLGRGSGVVVADVDHRHQRQLRARFPVLKHRRL